MYYRRCWAQTLYQTAKMSQRLDNTKWLWCLLALHAGSLWGTARSATKTPSTNPSTIEAQANFFQDFFSVQLSPYKIEFGHVCEDPNTWEQRYEKKDFKNHRDMGKVRWGDKKGGYGEHYWDLNHAGNADNHGDDNYGDDGSNLELNENDPYDEPSENVSTYNNDDYDPEKSSYEESGRAKRAHPKIKIERKHPKSTEAEYEEETRPQKQNRKHKEQLKAETSREEDETEDENQDEEKHYENPKPRRQKYRRQEDNPKPKEKKQFVLVVSHKDDTEKQQNQNASEEQTEKIPFVPQKQWDQPRFLPQTQPEPQQYLTPAQPELSQYLPPRAPERPHYVPYEGGAGVRQHQLDVSAATTVPRFFLEPSTGHVVDRATGQAYVLQPIAAHNNYN